SPGVGHSPAWLASNSVLVLYHALGDEYTEWLDILLGALEALGKRGDPVQRQDHTLRNALPFLLALAANDKSRFLLLLNSAFAHSFDYDSDRLERSLEMLKRFPALREALGRLFPLQPHRCLALADTLSLVGRLGKDAIAPLGYLEESTDVELYGEWQALVTIAP